jgi:general secretion pathway protein I
MQPVPLRPEIERGFTLIEVLVALAVIAIGLVAVLTVAARSGRVDFELQQRTFAAWVASNQIERMRLTPTWPSIGTSDGKVTLAGRDWHWKAIVAKTADPDLRRITISVATAAAPDDSITQLLGFLGRPLSKPVGLPGSGAARPNHGKGGN